MPIIRCLDKIVFTHTHTDTHTHIHNGRLLSHVIEWNLAICDNMVGCRKYYAKWNKLEKDEYPVFSPKGRI